MGKPLFRQWLKERLFKEEIEFHENARKNLQKELDAIDRARSIMRDELSGYKKSLSVVDVVRAQLAGFNPRTLDGVRDEESTDILVELRSENGDEDGFLAEMHRIVKQGFFSRLCEYVIRNQVLYTAKKAVNIDAVNFGRATVNGVELIKDELERLSAIYEERHEPPEAFDEHAVI